MSVKTSLRPRPQALAGPLLAVSLAVLLTATGCGLEAQGSSPSVSQITLNPGTSKTGDPPQIESIPDFSKVARQLAPSVVNISSEVTIEPQRDTGGEQFPRALRDFFGDDFFERFRGPATPQSRQSLGSGVIVDPKGYLLTNHHVVAPLEQRGVRRLADKIEVQISTGETYPAKVIGVDPESDLAVLKVDAQKTLSAASIGNSDDIEVGEPVLAIGSPFGLKQTVTAGIVSATGRIVPTGIFGDYIQTDAAINPGNSGGPLVNLEGEVVGINTFIATRTGSYAGVGFAVPSSVFVNSYNQLLETGVMQRGWLGVSMNPRDMTPEMARFFGVAGNDDSGILDGDGVIVAQLIDEKGEPADTGPAAKAGIREGDVIVQFGGREIESNWDLRSAVANSPPGENITVTVVRESKPVTLNVELASRTLERQRRAESDGLSLDEKERKEKPREIGIEFRTLSSSDARQLSLEEEKGVLILTVAPSSLADGAGLAPQQVITHVNGSRVEEALQFKTLVGKIDSGQGVVLRIVALDANRQKVVSYTSFLKP